jgi:hypothetical protein
MTTCTLVNNVTMVVFVTKAAILILLPWLQWLLTLPLIFCLPYLPLLPKLEMLPLLSLLPRLQKLRMFVGCYAYAHMPGCFALRTFPVLFILVSCNTSLIRPLNCINRNVPHLFLAIGRLQSVYSRQWVVTISECTLLDLSVTRLSCSFVESFKSLVYLILCLHLAFLPKWGGKTACVIILESTGLISLIACRRLT